MKKKTGKPKEEERKERINQFIIECIFSKYFEEEKEVEAIKATDEASHSLS